jgi:Fe(3+) dicitrate transport protein
MFTVCSHEKTRTMLFSRFRCSFGPALLACLVALSTIFAVSAYGADQNLEEVTIVGARIKGEQVAGSAHYVDLAQIEQLGHSDIQRIIRQIPGVSVQVEDGYGLRPNISIRGVATERSGRITLLEDNVLIAPAPYSAPSAYYFPTVGRLAGIEVLKGPAAITQGPYTIGGALNLISTPIPEQNQGRVVAEMAQDATYRVHAHYGAQLDNGVGVLVETHQWKSDGFQTIDRGGDSGLDVKDYTVKLSYAPERSDHQFELKWQVADQNSDQSYLGLTDQAFSNDSDRRYGLSTLDNIDTAHDQLILRHGWRISDDLMLTTTLYNNEHERDWFKTEGIDVDGSDNAESFEGSSWFNVIQAINSNTSLGSQTAADLNGILEGTRDTAVGAIQIRSNARTYYSRGMQFGLTYDFALGSVSHEFVAGLRIHEDQEDRLQRNSTYTQVDGTLVLADVGLLGNAGNRVQDAQATALHIYDRIQFGRWTLTPGLRYEDIEQSRTRWEIRAGRTTDPASRDASNFRSSRQNQTAVLLPGMGASYQLGDASSIFAGVHKGFTAPSNSPGVKEEEAINYELGYRFTGTTLHAEMTWFRSDYNNLLGVCTSSSGTDCTIGDAFNGNAATVQGLELVVEGELNQRGSVSIPLNFTYTYIDGAFDTDIADTAFFGNVSAGDPIPYIPQQQFNLVVGLAKNKWGTFLSASYVDEVCVRASCGQFERTDSSLTLDISSSYQMAESTELFGRIENITAAQDILGRQPYGARPNKARTAAVGIRLAL